MDRWSSVLFYISTAGIVVSDFKSTNVSDRTTEEMPMACPETYCKCQNDTVICQDNGLNLSYIPRLPPGTDKLRFQGNNIPELNRATLRNVTAIRYLRLMSNNISHITPDAFADFNSIILLDLSYNSITLPSLVPVIRSVQQKNVTYLYLRSMGLDSVPSGMFLKDSKITHLSLSGNLIDTFMLFTFRKLPNLRRLDLSFNVIQSMYTDHMYGPYQSLEFLDVSENKLSVFYTMKWFPYCYFPRLKSLHLEGNNIHYLSKLQCLVNLEELYLDRNAINVLRNNTFLSLSSLRRLSLNRVCMKHSIPSLQIEKSALNITSLLTLNVNYNNIMVESDEGKSFLKGCPNLMSLDLSGNSFRGKEAELIRLIEPLTSLTRLYLNDTGIEYFPDKLISNMNSLTELYLSDNFISILDGTFLSANVTVLYMDNNLISELNKTSFTEFLLGSVQVLNLAGNPFSCTCDSRWYLDTLKFAKFQLVSYPELYICMFPPNLREQNVTLAEYQPSVEECEIRQLEINFLPMIIPPASLSIVICVVLVSAYLARWHIRYWVFLLRSRGKKFSHDPKTDREYEYDGFVIYCDEDKDWVHHTLLPELEGTDNIKLCIHFRDFDVGKLIVDNIVENMEKSRKIIVVLSKSFAKSRWCLFELRLAQEKLINGKEHELIPILLSEISNSKMSNCVHILITMTTYMEWPKNSANYDTFWELVRKALTDR